MRCVSLICCAPGSRCCAPVSALVQKHRLASSAPLVRTILQVPRSAFVAGVLRRPLCRHTRQRAAPAIICITNRGYSHVALTEIVCMDALFPPRIQALLRRATTLQKRPEGLRQRKISHSLILSSGSDMSHRDASVGMKFVGYSCWEVFFSPPQHGLHRSAQRRLGGFRARASILVLVGPGLDERK